MKEASNFPKFGLFFLLYLAFTLRSRVAMETYHLMWTAQRTNQQIVAEIFRILQICQFWNFTPYLLLHLPLENTQGNCFFLFCYLKLIIFCRKIEFSCMMSLKRLWLIVLVKAKIECTFKPNLSLSSSVLLPASIGNNSILQNRFLPFYRICSRTLSLSYFLSLFLPCCNYPQRRHRR